MCWASFALGRLVRPSLFSSDVAGHLQHAYGHHPARRNPYGLETYLCDTGCHVTLGRERTSGSIWDRLAVNGGGK
jgi:hypothetical protein